MTVLAEKTHRNREGRAITRHIREKLADNMLRRRWLTWQRSAYKKQMLVDVKPYLVRQRYQRLLTKTLKALYNRRSYCIVKKAMRQQAEAYDSATKKRRVIHVLHEYTTHRRGHGALTEKARSFHRYLVFRRWLWLSR